MPLELAELELGRRVLSPGDRGYLVSLAKTRWNKHAGSEAMKLLKQFTQGYYEMKCPECKKEPKEPEVVDEASAEPTDGSGDGEKKPLETQNSVEAANESGILFVQRELVYNNCGFIATNLPDPSDFLYYVLNQMAEAKKDMPRTKFPFRIMPVQTVCEARTKAVERAAHPLMEQVLSVGDQPYRFSLTFRGNTDAENLTQTEARGVVRNVVWSINPNCVQCIKYQDYAIMMDILDPLFCIGIAKDFQKLGGYNTWSVRQGLDLTDQGEDSEDEISDDPNLDEEEEKRRKLRIKRKRRAEKAGLGQPDRGAKRCAEEEDHAEGEGDEEHDENGEEEGEEEDGDGEEADGVEENGV